MIWLVTVLFVVVASLAAVVAWLAAWKATHPYTAADLTEVDQAARDDNNRRSQRVRAGQIMEHLIWLMPDFAPDYDPKDAHFLGQPIDYVIFDGHTEGRPEIDVVFLEVKSGKSSVSTRQRRIRRAIEAGRVRWEVLRLPGVDENPPVIEIDFSKAIATFSDVDVEGIEDYEHDD